MKQFDAKILENIEIEKDIFNLRFESAYIADTARPGQFVEVLCQGPGAPFLKRPFGIYKVNKETKICEILFKKLGKGTEILSLLKKGAGTNITGPLGNGFEIKKQKTHLVVGGGMGVAPLMFLAEVLKKTGDKVYIFLGAKTAEELPARELFESLGEVIIATDDGSLGEKCMIDTPLERMLKKENNCAVYSCGPHAMLRCVADLAQKYNAPAQVSLEEKMACGLGVCQGCPVEIKNKDTKYKLVCKDGPVFNAEDIVW